MMMIMQAGGGGKRIRKWRSEGANNLAFFADKLMIKETTHKTGRRLLKEVAGGGSSCRKTEK
jgi:hypothetical protein